MKSLFNLGQNKRGRSEKFPKINKRGGLEIEKTA